MLAICRRHGKRCAHGSQGRKHRRCRCPTWADGLFEKQEIRKSLETRDWEEAQDIVREWETEGQRSPEPVPVA